MKEINIAEVSGKILEQLPEGAFLTVKHGDRVNTMTIGWGTLGRMWNRPVFMVMVRYSRYTYELIEKADSFTVSIPQKGALKKALAICGSRSGRDIDKFRECGLTPQEGAVESPHIAECDIHIDCRIIYRQPLDPDKLPGEIKNECYKNGDYHVLYYGEIVKTYAN